MSFCGKLTGIINGDCMSTVDATSAEPFNASARPTPSAEEAAEKTRRAQEEHTNSQRPAPGDTPDQLGKKLMTIACIYEPEPVHGEIARELIAKGANIHLKDEHDCTALLKAARAANAPLVKLLLEKGADPNATESQWSSDGTLGPAICHAAYRNSAEVIKLLLDAGADANAATRPGGRTALILAIDYAREAEETHNASVAALIEAGATPDMKTQENWTPMLYALKCKMPHTVKYLLDHGADPELRPHPDRYTPLEAAKAMCPPATGHVLAAISDRDCKARAAREDKEQLAQWIQDGCPAASGAKTMPQLKLKSRNPLRS